MLTEPDDELEALLESSWAGRRRRFGRRERRFETALLAAFVVAAVALALFAAPHGWRPGSPVVLLVLAYAAASLVVYPLGVADLVPTQPFLVALFALAPPAMVPLLVWAGLLVGRLVQVARGGQHPERLLLSGGDAIHALGPAAVLVAAGMTGAVHDVGLDVVAAAFAAQLVCDYVSATLRERVVHGVAPALQPLIMMQVAGLDAALIPLGVFAADTLDEVAVAPLGLLPLVGLLAYTARDRADRTRRLSERLGALRHERARLRDAVRGIGDALAAPAELGAVLDLTTRTAFEALDADGALATIAHGGERGSRIAASVGEADTHRVALAHEQRRALDTDGLVLAESSGRVVIAAPVRGEQTNAAIALMRREAFSAEEQELFEHFCRRAGHAAAHIDRHEALQRLAMRDELTGLVNHRRFQELLRAAVDEHDRHGTPVALVLLDLDHFKHVNDRFGHQTGDHVLRAVGQVLRAACRAGDEPARYGGEELAIVLAGTSLADAHALAERIRQQIAELELIAPDGTRLTVTASCGVAALDPSVTQREELLDAADLALYQAKADGRDRTAVHSPDQLLPRLTSLTRGMERRPLGMRGAGVQLALALARTLDAKQRSASGHADAVAHYCRLIAENLELPDAHVHRVWMAGLVHDIGKIAVPDHILNKPGPLTDAEYAQIKTHAEAGYQLLADTELSEQAHWVRCHHERPDGTGYPRGLSGDEIPLEARIIAVADAFEAMIADRPYRSGRPAAAAAAELRAHSGTQFDPVCVDALLSELAIQPVRARRHEAVAPPAVAP